MRNYLSESKHLLEDIQHLHDNSGSKDEAMIYLGMIQDMRGRAGAKHAEAELLGMIAREARELIDEM